MEKEKCLNKTDSDVYPKKSNSWIHSIDFKPLCVCVKKELVLN